MTGGPRAWKGLVRILLAVALVPAACSCAVLRHAAARLPAATGLPAVASLPDRTGGYLGVFEPGFPRTLQPVGAFSQATGVKPNLIPYYSGWREPFRTDFAIAVRAEQAIPLVQIDPDNVRLRAIAGGRYDTYLRTYALAVRKYQDPVVIGFAHEMNGDWYPWGWRHAPPRFFVAAWRHIVTVFRRAGARNVVWLWTIGRNQARSTGPIRRWWPGARYVDWVGITGYYYFASDNFPDTFGSTITQVRTFTHDPILLAEVGIGPVAGQAAKMPGLFAGIWRRHVLGLIWWDVTKHQGPYHQDWRIQGHPAALAAFRRGVLVMRHGPPPAGRHRARPPPHRQARK